MKHYGNPILLSLEETHQRDGLLVVELPVGIVHDLLPPKLFPQQVEEPLVGLGEVITKRTMMKMQTCLSPLLVAEQDFGACVG